MKAKDLFKKVEAANFIHNSTHAGGMLYITCDIIDADDPTIVDHVHDYRPYNDRFYSWNGFASTVAYEFHQDICDLIGSGELKYSAYSKSFYVENADWIIRFYVWDE